MGYRVRGDRVRAAGLWGAQVKEDSQGSSAHGVGASQRTRIRGAWLREARVRRARLRVAPVQESSGQGSLAQEELGSGELCSEEAY